MKGTGLGLSICKHFITKMGGDVKVESEGIGHGTSFIIQMRTISRLSEVASIEHKRHAYDQFKKVELGNIEKEQKEIQKIKSNYKKSVMVAKSSDVSLLRFS